MRADLTAAVKARDTAAEAARRDLTDADVRAIVENEVRERTAAVGEYDRLSRPDQAARLRAEAEVLSRYLAEES
jgi:uncharacterized protein YqeY